MGRGVACGWWQRAPRRIALVALVAVIGSVLVAVTAVVAPTPVAADVVPPCPPGVTSGNCLPAPTYPDDLAPPPAPVVPPPTRVTNPDVGNYYQTSFAVSGTQVGGWCNPGGVSPADTPCTYESLSVGAGLYVPGASDLQQTGGSTGVYVNLSDEFIPTGCRVSSCGYTVGYYPKADPMTLVFRVTTEVVTYENGSFHFPEYSYYFTVTLPGTAPSTPTANFTVTPDGTPGAYRFNATSTEPTGQPMTHAWDFGDGATGTGVLAVHRYSAAGTYTVKLTSTNLDGRSNTKSSTVMVATPRLGLAVELVGSAPPLDPARPVQVRVTATASDDGVGTIHGVAFPDGLLASSPADAFVQTAGPDPVVPAGGFDLTAGQRRSFDVTLEPRIIGRYALSSAVRGTDDLGVVQSATASSPGEIGAALSVTIALDPPFSDQEEGPDGPEPVDVTATVTFRNDTTVAMDEVTLTSLEVARTKAGQLLAVTQTGGVEPGVDGVDIGSLAPGQERSVTATFRATDDAEVEFTALALAHLVDGRSEIGRGAQRWSVKPKYLVGLTTRVTNPTGSALLPAGELIRVAGTVKNLSNTATVELGPLYPTLTGNAGVMSLAWDTTGTDPRNLVPAGNLTLEPGESRDFTVRILTTYSDPRRIDGPRPSGGTQANITFTPYGTATLEDGTTEPIGPEKVKATTADLTHRVAIDDSIEIPTFDPVAWAGAVTIGGVEGLWNATASIFTGVIDLVKMPYTVIASAAEIQSQVWESFTEAERQQFANDSGLMAAAVLMRNADFAQEGLGHLVERMTQATYAAMVDMENEWRVGDYTSTARLWSNYAADAVGQVVVPVALAKIAKSPLALRALARAQEALQARMAPILGRTVSLSRVEEVMPVLNAVASGTELTPDQLKVLYGITPEELATLQKLATDHNLLMTVRSRHASSIDWIERFHALLKPETLKIKTVSELDARLGYNASDIGSLVFRKPEALKLFDAGGGDLGRLAEEFAQSKGFVPGTGEYDNAVKRIVDRSVEWRKWEKYYKRWSDQGWIDVSFNYEGNAIDDTIRASKSELGIAPLDSGKYQGFRLRSIGEDDYVVEMLNGKVGQWVPVTGDIDPIAFTHLDGSPLTAAEHARLLDAMSKDPLLQTRHGESATFVKGGVDFVVGQFKPNEPGLQIAPGGLAPRVVRLDPEQSRWANPFDYHLHWDGGFVYSGSYIPKTAIPLPPVVVPSAVVPAATRIRAIPQAVGAEPNVGRCRITYGTATGNAAAVVDFSGKLRRLTDDGRPSDDTSLTDECFSPGPPVEKTLKPVTGLTEGATVGATELEVSDDAWLATRDNGGVRVGDTIVVGAGTDDAETATVTGFGSIIIADGLRRAHGPGELIVVIHRPDTPGPTTTTTSSTTTSTSTTTTTKPTTTTTTSTTTTVKPTTTTTRPQPTTTTTTKPRPHRHRRWHCWLRAVRSKHGGRHLRTVCHVHPPQRHRSR